MRFAMSGDLGAEIRARLGMTRQAYAEISRSIFHNRRLSISIRLSLLNSLIVSRLMYGCCAWSDITPKQLKSIESCLIGFQRSMLSGGF